MKDSASIVMIGAPESGKTNYLGRLWRALQSKDSALRATHHPDDIGYVLDALSHLLQGEFAPRTKKSDDADGRDCLIPVSWEREGKAEQAELLVPDVSGEIWERAVETNELPEAWMAAVRQSVGALLFVRVASSLHIPSLDWVTAGRLLQVAGAGEDAPREGIQIPTDVQLCEFLRFLELVLGKDADVDRPRVAVLVAAWDIVDEGRAQHGPNAYVTTEFPLFAGRLADVSMLEVQVFGVSVVGGDFDDNDFTAQFLAGEIDEFGYVVTGPGPVPTRSDVTAPVRWVLDGKVG